MTHSLHRVGTAESLKGDFVLIARPTMGFNEKGAAPRIRRMLEIIFEVGPTNLGSLESNQTIAGGLDPATVLAGVDDTTGVRSTFSSREKLKEVLRRLKEEDLGISVTVSGIVDDVFELCDEVGLQPHSINVSLGVHGNVGALAPEAVREVSTMCGHGLVASKLVEKVAADVRCGRKSAREGAVEAGRACACGIFNLDRAAALLEAVGRGA